MTIDDKRKVANCIAYVRSTIRCDIAQLEAELTKDEAKGENRVNSTLFDAKCRKLETLRDAQREYDRLFDEFMKEVK